MRKFRLCAMFTILSLSLLACNDTMTNVDSPQPEQSELYDINALIENQKEGFDNSNLEEALKHYVLEQEYRQLNDGEKQTNEVLIAFGEDNRAMMLRKYCAKEALKDNNGNYILDANGDYIFAEYDVYYHSRECSWRFDAASNTIITTDEYGIEYSAKVVYYDGEKLIYEGMICDEFTSLPTEHLNFNYLTLVLLTENYAKWDEWKQIALSYDTYERYIVAKEDKRLTWMLDTIEKANGNIDDKLFVETLLSKVFYLGYEPDGVESGAHYGDPGVYINQDGVWYWKQLFEGGHYPSTYVMMEDGLLRDCHLYYNGTGDDKMEQFSGEEVYYTTKWSYDEATNTLQTNGNSKSEVLYFDGEVAILKGVINQFPLRFNDNDYGLFYIDFAKLERDEVLERYDICLNDLL